MPKFLVGFQFQKTLYQVIKFNQLKHQQTISCAAKCEEVDVKPFSVWCPLKGHTYLTNLQLKGLINKVESCMD